MPNVMQIRVAREPGTQPGSWFYHVEDGWFYHLNNERNGNMYFKCIHYDSVAACRGRAVYRPDTGFQHSGHAHNHDPDLCHAEVRELKRCVLERCRTLDQVSYRNIIDQEGRRFSEEARSRVTLAGMRTSMRNARIEALPDPPNTLMELTEILRDDAFSILTMTLDGLDNVYGGSVTDVDGHHHVLLVSQRSLRFLRSVEQLHSDGTFRIVPAAPQGIDQVFTVVATWRHHVLPLSWALMESRSENAYTSVLGLLKHILGPNIQLRLVMTDFERSMHNAWVSVFGVTINGCLWHLCRAFIRKVGTLALIRWMRQSLFIKNIIRRVCAIALLPMNLMRRGLNLLIRITRRAGRQYFRLLRPFFTYVTERWLNCRIRRRWMCVHGSVHRTNNACESHHRRLKDLIGVHPNIYVLIEGIVRIEDTTHRDMRSLRRGLAAGRSRRSSAVHNDVRIRRLNQDLNNPPGPLDEAIIRYLRVASHTFENVVNGAMDDFDRRQ